jgi:hypothetical protein
MEEKEYEIDLGLVRVRLKREELLDPLTEKPLTDEQINTLIKMKILKEVKEKKLEEAI